MRFLVLAIITSLLYKLKDADHVVHFFALLDERVHGVHYRTIVCELFEGNINDFAGDQTLLDGILRDAFKGVSGTGIAHRS